MDIKQLIIKNINDNNIYNNVRINTLVYVLHFDKYKIIVDTNDNIDIEYIINHLSMDYICKLCIDRLLIFILENNQINYYDIELSTLYLLNMKNNIKYFNLILLD